MRKTPICGNGRFARAYHPPTLKNGRLGCDRGGVCETGHGIGGVTPMKRVGA